MANSALSVANVDFSAIKNELKTYLDSQSIFNDYNFVGSNLNVLLDVLAYNTFMQNFYLNQVASEYTGSSTSIQYKSGLLAIEN